MSTAIRLDNVSKAYGAQLLFVDASFSAFLRITLDG